ncbi:MAG: peptidoglycan DD-metalloendopeptidase family protein [Erysipelotrichaceae bacterium]|nr:peptidoglycan DD-metalloendopeptidase family protein [Erysipelotrichaceae bacterium]
MKKVLAVVLSLILAGAIVYGLPLIRNRTNTVEANIVNETSLVQQEILSYDTKEKTYDKIYDKGKLIGVISDRAYLDSLIADKYKDFEKAFPDTQLGLGNDVYIVSERSYANFANVDDQIMDYLVENDLLGVKTTAVEFSTDEGVYEIIYVRSYDDFAQALEQFYTNFVSDETIAKLVRGEAIESPKELGSVETNVVMHEKISTKEAIVSPTEIFSDKDSIYEFLCYGRNEERVYYTVREGDTLQGVGYYFGDMSPRQLVMLNPDVLSNENQVITSGMQLNVTYYTSPITIEVTRERLTQQLIVPEVPEYIEDEDLEVGIYEVRVQEESGIRNVLYEEKWINGVLESGEMLSENIIKQSKRGVIAVGTKQVYLVGTGSYIWPVDNPSITCHFGCYFGHTGTDIINVYEKYAPIYAVDSGTVDLTGYRYDMGNFVIINHNNGIRTMYMHLNVPAYVEEGQNVTRGQIIGQMGNTGTSEGVHLHLTFEDHGVRRNACNYLPCSMLY